MSVKTEKELKQELQARVAENKPILAKGSAAPLEELALLQANNKEIKSLLDQIREMSFSEEARHAAESEAVMAALFKKPDRPPMGEDGRPAPRHNLRAEQWALKSLGETLIESDAYRAFNPMVQGASMGIEFPNLLNVAGSTKATFTTSGSTLTQYDRPPNLVLLEQQRLTVADLLMQGQTNANTIRFPREDSYTNAATTVAEGAAKPEASFDTSEVDSPVRKIAVWAKVSNELYDDFPGMQSYIDGRLRFMVGEREEAQILNGDGNAPNLRGILQTSGIQTQAQGADNALDAIHKAITKVRSVGFFEPDAIVMHPTDYQIIRLAKDNAAQYYGGGPFTGAYGQNGYPTLIGPWGLRVVVTTAITAGTALVGNFRMGAMLFRRAGVTVQMTNSDQDDFIKNLITIRVETRCALAVWRPKAFSTVTGIAA